MKSFSQRKTLHYNNRQYNIDHSSSIIWEDFKKEVRRVISNNQLQFYGIEYDDQKDVVYILESEEWDIANKKFTDFSLIFDNPFEENSIFTEKEVPFDILALQKEMKDVNCLKIFEEANRKRTKEKKRQFHLLLQNEVKKIYPTDEEVYSTFKKNEQNHTYLNQVIDATKLDFPKHLIKKEQLENVRQRREEECFQAMNKKGEIVGNDRFHNEAILSCREKISKFSSY